MEKYRNRLQMQIQDCFQLAKETRGNVQRCIDDYTLGYDNIVQVVE